MNRVHLRDPRVGGVKPMCGAHFKLPPHLEPSVWDVTCRVCRAGYWRWREQEIKRAIKESGYTQVGF